MLFLVSCDSASVESINNISLDSDITTYNDSENMYILKTFEEQTTNECDYSKVIYVNFDDFNDENNIQLRSFAQGRFFSEPGISGRTYLSPEKIGFGGTNPLGLNGTYLHDLYEYYYLVTIPYNATLAIPDAPANPRNMGRKSFDTFVAGYTFKLVSKSPTNGDTYKLVTYVSIITHNVLGQQVGPYYYPYANNPSYKAGNSEVQNPNTFIFQWAWGPIQW